MTATTWAADTTSASTQKPAPAAAKATTATKAEEAKPAEAKAADMMNAKEGKPADAKAQAATGAAVKSGYHKSVNAVKSGYHKTTAAMKKHGKRGPCTTSAKSMNQCHST